MTRKSKPQQLCLKHNTPLQYSRIAKKWLCIECLQQSAQTLQYQREAYQRWRQSEKGKTAHKKYEQSEAGKEARNRYLHSDKYKAARKAYNERLKESLHIARAAQLRGESIKPAEKQQTPLKYAELISQIREFKDIFGKYPTVQDVKEWTEESKTRISITEVQQLIDRERNNAK